jgi:hypothetical protein
MTTTAGFINFPPTSDVLPPLPFFKRASEAIESGLAGFGLSVQAKVRICIFGFTTLGSGLLSSNWIIYSLGCYLRRSNWSRDA